MQLGMIGLGRMGANMTARLEEDGHDLKTYDPVVARMTRIGLPNVGASCGNARSWPSWNIPTSPICSMTVRRLMARLI